MEMLFFAEFLARYELCFVTQQCSDLNNLVPAFGKLAIFSFSVISCLKLQIPCGFHVLNKKKSFTEL